MAWRRHMKRQVIKRKSAARRRRRQWHDSGAAASNRISRRHGAPVGDAFAASARSLRIIAASTPPSSKRNADVRWTRWFGNVVVCLSLRLLVAVSVNSVAYQ